MSAAKRKTEHAFWDTSALVLLVVDQRATARARAIHRAYSKIVVWWGSAVEIESALSRLGRHGVLSAADLDLARRRAAMLTGGAHEVPPSDAVRDRAIALTKAHPLRTGDALQLAAALATSRDRPVGRLFVCFDERLTAVARDVGFDVRP